MTGCPEYSDFINEYALGDIAELTPDEKARLEAHLAQCEGCRQELQSTKDFLDLIRPPKDVEVPDWVIERVERNVRKAIWRDNRLRMLRKVAYFAVAATAAAAAILICLRAWEDRLPSGTPEVVERPSEEEIFEQAAGAQTSFGEGTTGPSVDFVQTEPTLEKEFAAITDHTQALALLQKEFDAAKVDSLIENFRRVIALAESLGERWPGSRESVDALKLISRCYTEIGELKKAQDAFFSYADAMGRDEAKRGLAQGMSEEEAAALCEQATVAVLREETSRLFRETDYTSTLAFCDAMRTRWPGKEGGLFAQFLTARCYGDTRQYADAEREYRQIISADPTSKRAMRARQSLPVILANQGRIADAVDMCQELADTTDDRQMQAHAYYTKGCFVMAMGEEHYTEALQAWQKVLKDYPDAKCLRAVKGMIAKLTDKITGHMAEKTLDSTVQE